LPHASRALIIAPVGYQTLYRKYRSRTFGEIIGQDHVVRILRGALSRGRVAHAYLFSGPRGTGKTSVARIFAKALNCPNVKDGEPCGECEVCTSIAEGRAPDVIEMDAASNRGVESIEELRRGVQFVPQTLKYKVYIIDEVHMISTHGFNALLKTLEEPPSHAIFILATTEPQQLPITILSRCLRFEFHRIAFDKLAEHVVKITKAEGCKIKDDAAMLLAELSEGSARDAISLLDQLIIAGEDEVTTELAQEMFGLTNPAAITGIVKELVDDNLPKLLEYFRSFISEGRDPEFFLRLLYGRLRNGYLQSGDDDDILEMLAAINQNRLLQAIEAVWDAMGLLRRTNHPVGLIEITLFKLTAILHGKTAFSSADYEDETHDRARDQDAPRKPEKDASVRGDHPEKLSSDSSTPSRKHPTSVKFDTQKALEDLKRGRKPVAADADATAAPESDDNALKKNAERALTGEAGKSKPAGLKTDAEPPADAEKKADAAVQAEPDEEIRIPVDASDGIVITDDAEAPVPEYTPDLADMTPDTDADSKTAKRSKAKDADEAASSQKAVGEKPSPAKQPKASDGKKKRKRIAWKPPKELPPAAEKFKLMPEKIWSKVLTKLSSEYFSTYCLMHKDSAVLPVMLAENVIYLAYPAGDYFIRGFAKDGRHRRAVEAIVKEVTGKPAEIVLDICEAKNIDISDDEMATLRAAQLEFLLGEDRTKE